MIEKWASNQNRILSEIEQNMMIQEAQTHYKAFMEALGIDVDNDPNSKDTPRRVAKMYVKELFKGRYTEMPKLTTFPNTMYPGIVFTKASVIGMCAHHALAFPAVVYMATIYDSRVKSEMMGLSKYSRIAEWYAARPTVQEELTRQIHDKLNEICSGNKGVAVYIQGKHTCAAFRGIRQPEGLMTTSIVSGYFREKHHVKEEYLEMIKNAQKG